MVIGSGTDRNPDGLGLTCAQQIADGIALAKISSYARSLNKLFNKFPNDLTVRKNKAKCSIEWGHIFYEKQLFKFEFSTR